MVNAYHEIDINGCVHESKRPGNIIDNQTALHQARLDSALMFVGTMQEKKNTYHKLVLHVQHSLYGISRHKGTLKSSPQKKLTVLNGAVCSTTDKIARRTVTLCKLDAVWLAYQKY